jgi:hypothetical protein
MSKKTSNTTTAPKNPIEYTFTVGKVDDTWKSHGLQEQFLLHNGKDVPFKAIVQKSQLMTIVGDKYKLLPNEEMFLAADEIAKLVGAVPFHEFKGKWYTPVEKHTFLTGDKLGQGHALYAFDKPYDLGKGDTIQLGFAVHNSIDGSLGLSMSTFTFRHACANMVLIGVKGRGMHFDDRHVLNYVTRRHTKNLSTDNLKESMLKVIEQGRSIIDEYKRLMKEDLTLAQAKEIIKAVPKKYVPEYISIDKEHKDKVTLVRAPTMWEVYNDLTAGIWHNDDTGYTSKRAMFNSLHKAVKVAPQVMSR